MKILLTGANGFIGRYLLARLVAAGHDVVPAVRRLDETDRLLAQPRSLRIDLNRDVTPDAWIPRLRGIAAVINCAGILQGGRGQSIEAIHAAAPIALFKACETTGVNRVIQISAISADAHTEYARSKRTADEALAASTLDWIVLRPSLVYAGGAYGGTALLRGLSALPFCIPVVGDGGQLFQPIHVDDLAAIVLKILATPEFRARVIAPVGPDVVALKDIVCDLRRWLGFGTAPLLQLPLPLINLVARIGDLTGGTINSTSLRQLLFGNTGSFDDLVAATGVRPRSWRTMLAAKPAQTQDRWHARQYFLRPALRAVIGATWIASGLLGLLDREALVGRYSAFAIALSATSIWFTCLLDLVIGCLVLARYRPRLLALLQLLTVAAYTTALTLARPSLWLDPLGPLLKNIPFVLSVLVLAAIENDR